MGYGGVMGGGACGEVDTAGPVCSSDFGHIVLPTS